MRCLPPSSIAQLVFYIVRMTLAYFGISALDLLGVLEVETSEEERRLWVEWIYAQQVNPDEGSGGGGRMIFGFSVQRKKKILKMHTMRLFVYFQYHDKRNAVSEELRTLVLLLILSK